MFYSDRQNLIKIQQTHIKKTFDACKTQNGSEKSPNRMRNIFFEFYNILLKKYFVYNLKELYFLFFLFISLPM